MSLFNDDYEAFVARLFAPHPEPAVRFTHAMLGVATEVHELDNAIDNVNALEELGDLLFYMRAAHMVLRVFLGEEAFQQVTKAAESELDAMEEPTEPWASLQVLRAHTLNELLDDAKRWLAYGKAPDAAKVLVGLTLVGALSAERHWPDDDGAKVDEAVLANRRKLQARYDGTFTKEAALNRNLEAERHALESAGTERA